MIRTHKSTHPRKSNFNSNQLWFSGGSHKSETGYMFAYLNNQQPHLPLNPKYQGNFRNRQVN